MSNYKVTGGCLCGGVKYEITKPPAQVHLCHCSMCRKTIGADFATIGWVPQEHFKYIRSDTLKEYASSKDMTRCFCGTCGCSIHAKSGKDGDFNHVTDRFIFFGSLDEDPGTSVDFHIFVKDKAPWVKLNDDLPKCDRGELIDIPPKE